VKIVGPAVVTMSLLRESEISSFVPVKLWQACGISWTPAPIPNFIDQSNSIPMHRRTLHPTLFQVDVTSDLKCTTEDTIFRPPLQIDW